MSHSIITNNYNYHVCNAADPYADIRVLINSLIPAKFRTFLFCYFDTDKSWTYEYLKRKVDELLKWYNLFIK